MDKIIIMRVYRTAQALQPLAHRGPSAHSHCWAGPFSFCHQLLHLWGNQTHTSMGKIRSCSVHMVQRGNQPLPTSPHNAALIPLHNTPRLSSIAPRAPGISQHLPCPPRPLYPPCTTLSSASAPHPLLNPAPTRPLNPLSHLPTPLWVSPLLSPS